jgi:hypothetical protein
LYKVEPRVDVTACNLLASDALRTALCNEPVPSGPKVPLVIKPAAFACRAERLARTGSCPERFVIGPSGASRGERPDTDPCEEMALREAS